MNKTVPGTRHGNSAVSSIIRAFITGAVVFTLCILLIPLLLTKVKTPEDFISVAAVATVAFTAFASAFAAGFKSERSFLLTGIMNALVIILILVCTSLIFAKNEEGKNYLFSGILYAVSIVFSVFGAKLAPKKNTRRKIR